MGAGFATVADGNGVVPQERSKDRTPAKPVKTIEPPRSPTATLAGWVRYDGPLEGPIVVQAWQSKPGNRALKLDGLGDYVLTSLTDLSGPEITIQFWFKGGSMQSAVRQQNGILQDLENEWSGRTDKTSLDPPQKGWIVASWNQFFILSHDGLLSGVQSSDAATNGHWHHVTMTWKQNAKAGFASYLDGQLVTKRDSRNVPIPNYQAPVFFGGRDGLSEFSQGQLDEIAIWKRALSEAEIRTQWNEKLTGNEPGLAGSFPDAETALAGLPRHPPQVVLMDINLPGMDGVNCVRHLKRLLPQTQFMMLTVYEDTDRIFKSLAAGATGYLLKRTSPDALANAIRELHAGGSPMTPQIARRVAHFFTESPPPPAELEGLTPHQRAFLDQLAQGYRYKEIADNLGISLDAVRSYVRRIYEKLQVHSRTEAVVKYLQR